MSAEVVRARHGAREEAARPPREKFAAASLPYKIVGG